MALDAADAAVLRAAGASSEGQQATALVEAVWWIGAADAYLWTAYRESWGERKATRKNGVMIDGIHWARSMAIHDPLAMLTTTKMGSFFTDVFTNLFGTHVWAEQREIEKFDIDRARRNRGYEAYDQSLAGRAVLDTLKAAIEDMRFDTASLESL